MNPKRKIIISLIIFGIIFLALFVFVILPLTNGIKKNSEALITAKRELALVKSETEKLDQLKKTYKRLEQKAEKMENLFASFDVPIDFIRFLEGLAENCQLLIDISPTSFKSDESDSWNSLWFRLTLSGSSSNLLKFIEKLENAPYLIEIQNLLIKKSTNSKTVDATLLIKVFAR